MKKGSPIKLIALLAAVLAIAAMYLTLSSYRQSVAVVETPTQLVVVAAQNLTSGTTLTADMVTTREVPVTEIMPGAVSDPAQVVGQKTNQHIYLGEQVIASKLGGTWLSYQLREGMRAVSLSVEIEAGVAGLIRPGDSVDVYYSTPQSVTAQNGLNVTTVNTVVLMENVYICAIDTVYNEDTALLRPTDAVYASVTLEVTPEQAQQLARTTVEAALNNGVFRLALRPRTEEAASDQAQTPTVDQGPADTQTGEEAGA